MLNATNRIYHGFEGFPVGLMRARKHTITVGWGLSAQSAELAKIDSRLYWSGWDSCDFKEAHSKRDMTLIVAQLEWWNDTHGPSKAIAGYAAVELFPSYLEIIRFGVAYPYQRLGIGTALIRQIKSALTPGKRRAVAVDVDESNVAAQLFLKARGFILTKMSTVDGTPFQQRDPHAGQRFSFYFDCEAMADV